MWPGAMSDGAVEPPESGPPGGVTLFGALIDGELAAPPPLGAVREVDGAMLLDEDEVLGEVMPLDSGGGV